MRLQTGKATERLVASSALVKATTARAKKAKRKCQLFFFFRLVRRAKGGTICGILASWVVECFGHRARESCLGLDLISCAFGWDNVVLGPMSSLQDTQEHEVRNSKDLTSAYCSMVTLQLVLCCLGIAFCLHLASSLALARHKCPHPFSILRESV